MDGILRKTWEVHCFSCERPELGIPGEKPTAPAELRRLGWSTRQGAWICPSCVIKYPAGTSILKIPSRSRP